MAALAPKAVFQFFQFAFGGVQAAFGGCRVVLADLALGFIHQHFHAMLAGDELGANSEAGGGLLLLELAQAALDAGDSGGHQCLAMAQFFQLSQYRGVGAGGLLLVLLLLLLWRLLRLLLLLGRLLLLLLLLLWSGRSLLLLLRRGSLPGLCSARRRESACATGAGKGATASGRIGQDNRPGLSGCG